MATESVKASAISDVPQPRRGIGRKSQGRGRTFIILCQDDSADLVSVEAQDMKAFACEEVPHAPCGVIAPRHE